jgi:PPOX class probable F420-dependent enzyme
MGLTVSMIEIPADRAHLLEQPIFAYLGTIRPDDTVQVNPMWFKRVDDEIHFTHTTKRAKYRNLQHNPSMSLLIVDPADPFSWIELRGRLVRITPDPTGSFYVTLGKRYGNEAQKAPADSPDRVVLEMSIDSFAR